LRAVDGTFVYAVNGDSYFRTAVKVGAESESMVEITDGLLAGDAVVTKPVDVLWLIELRATKGGGGCTH
jgi:multidrug efflux pump subunit AcrA (membrane-fusion protein)